MKCVGSIFQNFSQYFDHLAPLCSLLKMPFLVTEKNFADQAKKYYPDLQVILHEDYPSYCKFLVKNFDFIFSCQMLYSDPFSLNVLQSHSNNFVLVWLPHGNSDKGWHTQIFKPLEKERVALVYGEKMLDAFKAQNVFEKIPHKFILGNFRCHYYQKHKQFLDNLIQKECKKLDPTKKTILYAPTWEDYENNGSYQDTTSLLIENLPKNFNLLIKPHHNTYLKFRSQINRLSSLYLDHPNILILENFPPIYPLLNFSDIYLGDMSSIGYDFLTFNKPMFFLNKNAKNSQNDPSLYLFRCGVEIKTEEIKNVFTLIQDNLDSDKKQFSTIRKQVASYTFGKLGNFNKLKEQLKMLV